MKIKTGIEPVYFFVYCVFGYISSSIIDFNSMLCYIFYNTDFKVVLTLFFISNLGGIHETMVSGICRCAGYCDGGVLQHIAGRGRNDNFEHDYYDA